MNSDLTLLLGGHAAEDKLVQGCISQNEENRKHRLQNMFTYNCKWIYVHRLEIELVMSTFQLMKVVHTVLHEYFVIG